MNKREEQIEIVETGILCIQDLIHSKNFMIDHQDGEIFTKKCILESIQRTNHLIELLNERITELGWDQD